MEGYHCGMSFFAILFALLLEQVRPLSPGNWIHAGVRAWVRWVEGSLDTGQAKHGWLAWTVAVIGPAAVSSAVYWGLWQVSVVLAFAWNALLLYATLGFRQFSHYFTDIRNALDAGDEQQARALLAQWQQIQVSDLPRSEIVRHVIEFSVLGAHRHVFGVLCCFSILSAIGLGPAGAVAYRLSEFVQRYWEYRCKKAGHPVSDSLRGVASRCWKVVDFLPARATALCFAVVGSFEDAIDCWRNYAQRFPDDNDGVILAATSGAVNVRLGGEAMKAAFRPGSSQGFVVSQLASPEAAANSEPTPGRTPEVAHLRQVVGLVWRSVVLWMVLLVLLTLARLLG
jgi:adenosylcobinamide-phosphate synthase